MAWQPAPESLRQLAACLKDSLSGFDKNAQRQAETMLAQAKESPDINNYLAYIFSSPDPPEGLQFNANDYHLVRSSAAIMIKNNVRSGFKQIPESSLSLIKMAVPICLQDKNSQIRNYAGNIATELIRRGGLMAWPELLPQLLEMIGNSATQVSNEAQEGAMSAMAKICEDNYKILSREHNGQKPLQFILPKLLEATKSTSPIVRAQALTAMNVFAGKKTPLMSSLVDGLLQHLFVLASDQSADVRRQVCRSFVLLVDSWPEKIEPHMQGLVDYLISQQKDDDEDLACEAAEFWLSVGEHENLWQALTPYIRKIVPVLLECMVYSGEDIALLGGESDDEDEEDRTEDIKPTFAKKSAARTANGQGSASMDPSQGGNAYEKLANMDDDLEEGEVDEFDDGDDANPDERWTIRKCSAAALDVFARDFKAPVFECIMPYLENNLRHDEWPLRETAVLALGAVADGCMEYVAPHLPELIPFLITLLEDPEPVVRKITCWTLGRYSAWAAHLKDSNQRSAYFEPMMDGILRKMLDKNKKVQEAGASAFANLEENAGRALEPYCGPIIRQFVQCFRKYKDKNMYILYDCVQTLAEHLGPALARPEHVNELMPALIDRYQKVSDDSREIFPLLECLSYVAMALGDAFSPFARPIFLRCVSIIHMNLQQSMAAVSNPGLDQPDKDFLVTSLDLLSAIIQALSGSAATDMVKETQASFFELLTFCMEDLADEVRQSAYALLGDCSKYVFPLLQPHLGTIFPILVKQLDLDSVIEEDAEGSLAVINNACWSAGEIAMQHGKGMAPFLPELLSKLTEIISNPLVTKGVNENAAIALGRLGLENSEQLAPALPTFADDFLNAMTTVDPSEEKATAFKGFTMIVGQNPHAMEKSLLRFFIAIAKYQDVKLRNPVNQDLHDIFQSAINVYKQMIPQFDDFINQMPASDQQALKSSYMV